MHIIIQIPNNVMWDSQYSPYIKLNVKNIHKILFVPENNCYGWCHVVWTILHTTYIAPHLRCLYFCALNALWIFLCIWVLMQSQLCTFGKPNFRSIKRVELLLTFTLVTWIHFCPATKSTLHIIERGSYLPQKKSSHKFNINNILKISRSNLGLKFGHSTIISIPYNWNILDLTQMKRGHAC